MTIYTIGHSTTGYRLPVISHQLATGNRQRVVGCVQQILGSCSPLSMSTIRFAPITLRMVT